MNQTATLKNNIPLSLYIHIPFCLKKCPYCDFISYTLPVNIFKSNYIQAIINDLSFHASLAQGRNIISIFMGGGTPSLFSAKDFDRLFNAISASFSIRRQAEISIEINPKTVTKQKLYDYHFIGFNRLSIGIQTFHDKHLHSLHRIHSSQEAIKTIQLGKQAGFHNINLDLMYGLPGQTMNEALSDLNIACDLSPTHLSWYPLTIEPNTPFALHPPPLQILNEEELDDLYQEGRMTLKNHHFIHYETSAFCQKNFQCQHNINYWQFGDYLGIGAGAHGKITTPISQQPFQIIRQQRFDHPQFYMEKTDTKQFIAKQSLVKPEEIPFEFMMNALRLIQGIPKKYFEQRTGLPLHTLNRPLQQAISEGFLRDNTASWRPTTRGQRFLNDCLQLFLPDE